MRAQLESAEARAAALFEDIAASGIVKPGRRESAVNEEILAMARRHGAHKHWHKRIVRAGRNTLCPFDDDPTDLEIQDDDIVFIDLGPVFAEWEADFGRTFVLGDDPVKHRLVADGEACWQLAKAHVDATPDLSAEKLFEYVAGLAADRGWQMGQWHSGHLVGDFPHERPPEKVHNFVMPGNDRLLRDLDSRGRRLQWILEVHFVDPEREIGSFFEQLL